jgi:hypothetical protein
LDFLNQNGSSWPIVFARRKSDADHFAMKIQKTDGFPESSRKIIMSTETSNAEQILTKVPKDVFIGILEYVCEQLLGDIKKVPASDSITQYLNQYAQLDLVCRSFHDLLTHYVLADGVLIRTRLTEAQILHFKTLLKSKWPVGWSCMARLRPSIGPPQILGSCGYVWKNPLFPRFLPSVFIYDEVLTKEALDGFRYLWKKWNEMELAKNRLSS